MQHQQKLHPGVPCAVHPEKPFDFAEKAYWLQRHRPQGVRRPAAAHRGRRRQLQENLCGMVRITILLGTIGFPGN
jgi:cyclohexadienyl dehydratase